MEQHPVPQHIASFEFKLFGNLTIKQFVRLAIPMSVATIIFFSGIPVFIRLPLSFLFGLFGLFIALVPISGRPFEKWFAAFVKAIFSPTLRIWIKEKRLPQFLTIVIKPSIAKVQAPKPITEKGRGRLLAYIRSLPREKLTPLDVIEQIAIQRLGLSPTAAIEEGGKLPPPILWPREEEMELPYNFRASLPQVAVVPQAEEEAEAIPDLNSQTRTRIVAAPKISAHAKPYILPGLEKKFTPQPAEGQVALRTHLASETNFALENVIPITTPDQNIKLVHGVGKTRVRKLHFAPPSGFDLSKLPIRGEPRLEISEELKKRYQLADPFLGKIPVDTLESTAPPVLLPQDIPAVPKANGEHKPPTQEESGPTSNAGLPKKAQFVPRAKINLETPKKVSLKPKKKELLDSIISVSGQKTNIPLTGPMLSPAQIVPLTNKPNVLSGLVTDASGSPIVGAILTVRDANGIPTRALKTNKLGQFLSATPLENGQYSIEIEGAVAVFKPIVITLTDQVLAPLEIKAEGRNN